MYYLPEATGIKKGFVQFFKQCLISIFSNPFQTILVIAIFHCHDRSNQHKQCNLSQSDLEDVSLP